MLAGLQAVQDRLKNLAALSAYFNDKYGKAPRHFIGYKKIGSSAFLPAICYVPTQGKRNSNVGEETISLVVQIMNKGETDDEFTGVIEVNEIADLIVEDFNADRATGDFLIEREIEVVNAIVETHPFYEIEISIVVKNNSLPRTHPWAKQER